VRDLTATAPPIAWAPLLALAAAKFAIHLGLASRYGFHRDELYYVVCGRHLAWGYVDHPPIAPLAALLVDTLVGPSLVALRTVPALIGAVLVVLAGLVAREMGGRAWAQILTGTAMVAAPIFLLLHHFFQTVAFDQLAWVGATLLVVRILRTSNERLWLAVGIVAGLGLLAKHTVALFGLGLAAGLLLTQHRRHLLSPWLWTGGVLASLIVLPNVVWQATHDWPTLEFVRNNNARVAEEFSWGAVAGIQAAFLGIGLLPLLLAGTIFLFGSRGARFRPAGWIWLVVTALLLVLGGKPYYPAPAWPAMFAAGAVLTEFAAERRAWRRLRTAIPVAVLLATVPMLWLILPVLPRHVFAAHQDKLPHKEFHEEFGWDDLAAQVATVYRALPDDERARARIMTESYGEAAALDVLGPRHDLPRVTSPHNSYYFWGHPDTDVVIAIAWSRRRLDAVFEDVREVARVTNSLDIRNQSSSQTIYICRRPLKPWPQIWEELRFFV
jgi:4-amino-4-deoxy-L-arabinose transferase-like glycosyltransferase